MRNYMKCAVISLGSISSKMVAHALKEHFDVVDSIDLREIEFSISGNEKTKLLYQGQPLPHYDCMYIKGSYRYALLLRAITQFFTNDKTYIPVHAESFVIVNDKLLTHLELDKAKIPMPKTYVVATVDSGKEILNKMVFPVIIKIPQGTHGKGVMVADSIASAKGVLDTLHSLKQPFIIQEYIDCNGEDIRCFVVGDRVVASMKRKSVAGDIRSNIHSGGVAESYIPSDKIKDIAVKAAKQLNCEICGVDILETPFGGVVVEANVSPGLQGITKATGLDIAGIIAKFLYNKTKEKLESSQNTNEGRKVIEEEIGHVDTKKHDSEKKTQDIITSLDFRGDRILLPEIVTKMTGFKNDTEYMIDASKDRLEIKKL